jgi:hypothetical protein
LTLTVKLPMLALRLAEAGQRMVACPVSDSDVVEAGPVRLLAKKLAGIRQRRAVERAVGQRSLDVAADGVGRRRQRRGEGHGSVQTAAGDGHDGGRSGAGEGAAADEGRGCERGQSDGQPAAARCVRLLGGVGATTREAMREMHEDSFVLRGERVQVGRRRGPALCCAAQPVSHKLRSPPAPLHVI